MFLYLLFIAASKLIAYILAELYFSKATYHREISIAQPIKNVKCLLKNSIFWQIFSAALVSADIKKASLKEELYPPFCLVLQ